jgi:hypothetical protein
MDNIKEFLLHGVKESERTIDKHKKLLQVYSWLLKEVNNGTFTSGDFKVTLKHFRVNKDLYPYYEDIRNAYRVYNLLNKK